jgi:hypothetical protein
MDLSAICLCSIPLQVIPVAGDLTEDRLGLDDRTYESLAASVNVILHIAATIDFTERLDVAVARGHMLPPIPI